MSEAGDDEGVKFESKYEGTPDSPGATGEGKRGDAGAEEGKAGDADNNGSGGGGGGDGFYSYGQEATSFGFSRVVNPPGSYGGKTISLEHAESPHSRVSKRYDAITDGAQKLEDDQTFLRAQAIAKNRAFVLRIEALHERIGRWKVRVAAETEAREKEDAQIRVALATKLADLDERFVRRLDEEYRIIDAEQIPAVHQRYDDWYADFREFVDVIVPEVIERQQGTVTRHLKKARESFEIDCTKLMQREQEIRDAFAQHVTDAKQMQEQETKTRRRDQLLLEEVINERTRVWDRCEEDFYAPYMEQITEMKGAMKKEVEVRAENDMVVLETMKESMDRLQAVVLSNFGVQLGGRRRRK
jgi:hypothetical protein